MSSKIVVLQHELVDRVINALDDEGWHKLSQEVLDAIAAPVVERQPTGDWAIDNSAGRPILVYKACSVIEAEDAEYILRLVLQDREQPAPELAELQAGEPDQSSWPSLKAAYDEAQATINQLTAEIERLKGGQGEPVTIEAVAVTRDNGDGSLRLEWLLEGGIAQMEFAGMVLFALPEANELCDEDGSAEIYLSQPAPVSVVLPEPVGTDGYGERSPYSNGWNACLDKVKELNQ